MAKPSLLKAAFKTPEPEMKPALETKFKPKGLPKTPKLLKVAKKFKQLSGK